MESYTQQFSRNVVLINQYTAINEGQLQECLTFNFFYSWISTEHAHSAATHTTKCNEESIKGMSTQVQVFLGILIISKQSFLPAQLKLFL